MKKLSLLLTLALLSIISCQKDGDDIITGTPNTEIDYNPEVIAVTATLFGIVQDENEIPMPNTTVELSNNTTTTDAKGRFFFKNITMNEAGTCLRANKSGYFEGSDRFFPKEASANFTKITLLSKSSIGSFSSTEGGSVSSTDGISLDFPANSIVNAAGEIFNGEVNVLAKWIDPTADNLGEIMPGNLQGVDSEFEYVSLLSTGMIAVELETTTGVPLNLGNGQSATMTITVPDELLNSASSEIPLWYFNEELGLWVEDGKAVLVGNQYIGEVDHFTYWFYAAGLPSIVLSGKVISNTGTPFQNIIVWVSTLDGWYLGHGITNNDGFFEGPVIANQPLKIEILYDFDCPLYEETVDPFDSDTDLGDINIQSPDQLDITSAIYNCDNTIITEGILEVLYDGLTYHFYTDNGTIEGSIVGCNTQTELSATPIDLTNLIIGNTEVYSIINPLNIGVLSACPDQITEWCIVTVDGGEPILFRESWAVVKPDSISFVALFPGTTSNVSIRFKDIGGPAIYSNDNIKDSYIRIPSDNGQHNGMTSDCGQYLLFDCEFDTIVLTQVGSNSGEHIVGYYEGTVTFTSEDSSPVSHFIRVDFKIAIA